MVKSIETKLSLVKHVYNYNSSCEFWRLALKSVGWTNIPSAVFHLQEKQLEINTVVIWWCTQFIDPKFYEVSWNYWLRSRISNKLTLYSNLALIIQWFPFVHESVAQMFFQKHQEILQCLRVWSSHSHPLPRPYLSIQLSIHLRCLLRLKNDISYIRCGTLPRKEDSADVKLKGSKRCLILDFSELCCTK